MLNREDLEDIATDLYRKKDLLQTELHKAKDNLGRKQNDEDELKKGI